MGNHVFICYAREDWNFVQRIALKLKELGVPIWLDQWDIPRGANWNQTRDNALYGAAQCLVILSSAAVNSEQVQAEWVTALEEKKPLIPILYQTCRIPSRLRLIQRFDFTKGGLENEEILESLLRALGSQQEPLIITSPPALSEITNSVGMKLILIPAGEFLMGSENGGDDEKPVRRVQISKPFYLGKYPVTQAQWETVMGNNPSRFKGEPNRPVDTVSWNEAQEFLRKLSAREGGKPYRLPTEAEWEYACRAGSRGTYYFGDNEAVLGEYAWYTKNIFAGVAKFIFRIGGSHPVGQLKPNEWGLYDMLGNVWEWVQDWYAADYYKQRPNPDYDPQGPDKGEYRVLRGGSWDNPARHVRVASRGGYEPGSRHDDVGFRCAQ